MEIKILQTRMLQPLICVDGVIFHICMHVVRSTKIIIRLGRKHANKLTITFTCLLDLCTHYDLGSPCFFVVFRRYIY